MKGPEASQFVCGPEEEEEEAFAAEKGTENLLVLTTLDNMVHGVHWRSNQPQQLIVMAVWSWPGRAGLFEGNCDQ